MAIGLNSVDPNHYSGWSGPLSGCEPDVDVMKKIALDQNLEVETLKTKQAKRENVLKKLTAYAEKLKAGDLLVLSYSGHGGQIRDENDDEDDGFDETWCLYDGQMLDDEIHGVFSKFKKGVRILSFSDSCHSGTVLRASNVSMDAVENKDFVKLKRNWQRRTMPAKLDKETYFKMKGIPAVRDPSFKVPEPVARAMPPVVSVKTYMANKEFYKKLGREAPKEDPTKVLASVVLISGCQDHQYSADMGFNGLFTFVLKTVWADGKFSGDLRKFYETIREKVLDKNSTQAPNIFTINEDETFMKQKPYTVKY